MKTQFILFVHWIDAFHFAIVVRAHDPSTSICAQIKQCIMHIIKKYVLGTFYLSFLAVLFLYSRQINKQVNGIANTIIGSKKWKRKWKKNEEEARCEWCMRLNYLIQERWNGCEYECVRCARNTVKRVSLVCRTMSLSSRTSVFASVFAVQLNGLT